MSTPENNWGAFFSRENFLGASIYQLRFYCTRRINKRVCFRFVNSGTYYGLSWNTSNLGGGNDYVNFLISGAVEVPAYSFLIFTLNRWGRKLLQCGCMLASGTALLLTMFVPAGTLSFVFSWLSSVIIPLRWFKFKTR